MTLFYPLSAQNYALKLLILIATKSVLLNSTQNWKGSKLRQQHNEKNIWMLHSTRKTVLEKRWGSLFVISAVTTTAFLSVSFALWQTGIKLSQYTF